MEKLALIDANYLVNRSVHKNMGLTTSNGIPTGGIFIFMKSLWNMKNLGKSVLVFDGGKSPFRIKLYPGYKKREKDEKLKPVFDFTFKTLDELLPKMGLVSLRISQVEADDALYILAKEFKDKFDVTVVSDDKDFLQFTKLGVTIYRPMRGEYWTYTRFTEKWKFKPEFFTLWRSLMGDTSDKIPGVPKLGCRKIKELSNKEKVANYVIKQLCEPSLLNLHDWAERNPEPIGNKLIENFLIIKRNYLLMNLDHSEVESEEVIQAYNECKIRAKLDAQYIIREFHKLEFKDLPIVGWLSFLNK